MFYCCILSTAKVRENFLKFVKYTKIYSEREKIISYDICKNSSEQGSFESRGEVKNLREACSI